MLISAQELEAVNTWASKTDR